MRMLLQILAIERADAGRCDFGDALPAVGFASRSPSRGVLRSMRMEGNAIVSTETSDWCWLVGIPVDKRARLALAGRALHEYGDDWKSWDPPIEFAIDATVGCTREADMGRLGEEPALAFTFAVAATFFIASAYFVVRGLA